MASTIAPPELTTAPLQGVQAVAGGESSDVNAARSLIFRVGGRVYSCDITAVREVVTLSRVTRIPRADESVAGVTNLRGHVVTIVDANAALHGECGVAAPMALLVDVGPRGVCLAVERVVDVRELRAEEDYVELDVRDLVARFVSIQEES